MGDSLYSQHIRDKLATLSEFPVLESDCIRLRGLREEDLDGLFRLFSDPQVMRYWSRGPMSDRREALDYAKKILDGFSNRNVLNWIAADPETDDFIGTCTLYEINPEHARAGLGYALMPSYWGKGLASEAATLAISYGFFELGLHRIEADTEPNNIRSNALLDKLGFHREGLLRQRFHHPDGIQDSLVFGLLKAEWLAYLTRQGYQFEAT
jgi:[ribosomal protein S5]-alanine N-acetyltransferase